MQLAYKTHATRRYSMLPGSSQPKQQSSRSEHHANYHPNVVIMKLDHDIFQYSFLVTSLSCFDKTVNSFDDCLHIVSAPADVSKAISRSLARYYAVQTILETPANANGSPTIKKFYLLYSGCARYFCIIEIC